MSTFAPHPGLTVFTTNGQPLVLDREIGKGGEGSVWSISGAPAAVAKFYHQGLTVDKARKLEAMCRLKSDSLLRVSAWPTDLVRSSRSGHSEGLLMPRISGYKEAHLLYTPKSRRVNFPEAQFPFILHSAINIARAFATVHDAGQVIGDVNHGNLLISQDAQVALIDCDSFEINDGGIHFPCLVGVPDYTPPELQGKSFQGVRRTQQHDVFGLAIMLFHMLFLGRHPFSGIFRQGTGDVSVVDAIREFRFAYSPDGRETEMDQPPWVPPLSIYPPDVGVLFMRAFGRDGPNGRRPAGRDWIPVLESLSRTLKRCVTNESHHYFQGLSSCPWCTAEKASGVPMFGFAITVLRTEEFDLIAVWAQIESVRPDERETPQFSNAYVDQCKPGARVEEIRKKRRNKRALSAGTGLIAVFLVGLGIFPALVSLLILVAGLALMISLWGDGQVLGELEKERKDTWREYEAASSRWKNIRQVPESFALAKKRLESQKEELLRLPSHRAWRIEQMRSELERKQLIRFLEKHRIEDASIPGIGQGRKNLLRAYSIVDASDVHQGLTIKGFGPALKTALLDWQVSIVRRFVFNPNENINPADIRSLDLELNKRRADLVQSLSSGPQALKQIILPWQSERSKAIANMNYWIKAVAQADVDMKALSRW